MMDRSAGTTWLGQSRRTLIDAGRGCSLPFLWQPSGGDHVVTQPGKLIFMDAFRRRRAGIRLLPPHRALAAPPPEPQPDPPPIVA